MTPFGGNRLQALRLAFSPRFIVLTLCALLAALLVAVIASDVLKRWDGLLAVALILALLLVALGARDMAQTGHSILRNYPIAAHIRFLLEAIRPEIRQYFFESEKDGLPFPRDRRAIVYQRAKMALDKRPFGTQFDIYAAGYEWLQHSIAPRPVAVEPFRVSVGGPDCARPASLSVLNISAMSFGSLSANAIRALNAGARKGGFAHDTGEGGFSPYHREKGGDIIWEIGSGYFGCRNADGTFDADKFAEVARAEQIKMIEIKLSQGAKPGHGGVLPGAKVTPEIADDPRRRSRQGLPIARLPFGLLDAARNDGLHRPLARIVEGQAGRLQALPRPFLGVPGGLQGDAGDENLSGLHRRRRQGGRHRRGAARIHGPSRHADARGPRLHP